MCRRSVPTVLILLAACGGGKPEPERLRVIGEAHIGALSAILRPEPSNRVAEVAKLPFGEKVEIVERRRRFYRVRSAAGAVGWLDGRQLITAGQLAAIAKLRADYAKTPRLGEATVYETLNIHNEPNRSSPSIAQIPEKGLADVLLYRVAPRVPYRQPPLIEEAKPAPRKKREKKPKEEQVEPPPKPPAPEPPEDLDELSSTPAPELDGPPGPDAIKTDDWTLVRLRDGAVGWALSSRLVMAIPDDVAQYSEGHRIMGYWVVGEADDGGVKKNHYLWATMSQKDKNFHFDGFRVFMYSTRRHRYEQAYREKNLRGYFPLDVVRPGRKPEYLAEFSVISEDDKNPKRKRTFAFLGYRVLQLE